MQFIDTHCHIHFKDYALDADTVLQDAKTQGVGTVITVGTTLADSQAGVAFAQDKTDVWAAVGLHPHEARHYINDRPAFASLASLAADKNVVAIGECGLDYYYEYSPRNSQQLVLEQQLQIAQEYKLPVIFHVRDAFDDFFPIFDNFPSLTGVVHSFTSGKNVLNKVLSRSLMVGLNGIMTFTKDQTQLDMARTVPLEQLVLETDAPFLTPVPFRGTICEPKHVVDTARFLSGLREEPVGVISKATTKNAQALFQLG